MLPLNPKSAIRNPKSRHFRSVPQSLHRSFAFPECIRDNSPSMAKRKGKSQQRIKDWHQRYLAGEADDDTAPRRMKLSARAVKLPSFREDDDARSIGLEGLPTVEGMVVGMFPGGSVVRVGDEEMLCGIAKTFRAPEGSTPLTVGDVATVAITRSEHADATSDDRDRADGMVVARGPRETALSRPQPRSGKRTDEYKTETFEKVIAANMDVLLIVAATRQPPLRHGLIDRYLIIAERGELQPILVINKIDLDKPDKQVLADFKSLGIDVLLCSAATGKGTRALSRKLTGKRSILAGASGVGKSTLINAIVPDANAATRTVRAADERGRHTTTAAVVYDLPGGGMLIDTPGIRELGMRLDATELPWYFPEFEALAPACRFNNCTHTHEPECAVLRAVEAGDIVPRRYESYLRILDTLSEG